METVRLDLELNLYHGDRKKLQIHPAFSFRDIRFVFGTSSFKFDTPKVVDKLTFKYTKKGKKESIMKIFVLHTFQHRKRATGKVSTMHTFL